MAVPIAPLQPDLRQRLQMATKDIHEALHVHPILKPLGSPDITLDQYANIIEAFAGFYNEQEPIYKHFKGTFSAEIDPLPLLLKDLSFLNRSIPAPLTAAQQVSLEEYIGYLYLKQGSTLGGQVISKGLEKHLGLIRGQTINFFYGAGPETGPNWKAFEAFIEGHETDWDADKVISHAQYCFEHLYNHLTSIHHG